jgi:hypothetical protein
MTNSFENYLKIAKLGGLLLKFGGFITNKTKRLPGYLLLNGYTLTKLTKTKQENTDIKTY